MQSAQPGVAAAAAYAVLGEPLTVLQVIGTAVALAAIAAICWSSTAARADDGPVAAG